MSKYFDLFPTVLYDIAGKDIPVYESVTNVFFRLRVIRKVLTNISAYYEYVVQDGDTPEILAEKIYGDMEAHWVILMANDIVDAQYDWPLTVSDFNRYLIKKYGSVENAHNTVHHYDMVIKREESATGTVSEFRYQTDYQALNADPGVPYDAYESLSETQEVVTVNMGDGKTVTQTTYREAVSVFAWEDAQNEAKRLIKIIKPEYYPRIIDEFNKFTNNARNPHLRKLV